MAPSQAEALEPVRKRALGEVVTNGRGGRNRLGIPFWLVGELTTHFRTYLSGWIESDVHWGLTDLDLEVPPKRRLL